MSDSSSSENVPVKPIDDPVRADFPRQLIIYDEKTDSWQPCADEDTIIRTSYLAVSYRQSDFPFHEAGKKEAFESDIHMICEANGLKAYWLDYACTGTTFEDKNKDIYRIADVFRGAAKTLLKIKGKDKPHSDGWLSWGDRIWTLPEALLSQELICKVGDDHYIPKRDLRTIANFAYKNRHDEMVLINNYKGKDHLPLEKLVEILRIAIWKRTSGPGAKTRETLSLDNRGVKLTAYLAEKVYALMGLLPFRILPDPQESEEAAFARLMVANSLDSHIFPWDIGIPKTVQPDLPDTRVTSPPPASSTPVLVTAQQQLVISSPTPTTPVQTLSTQLAPVTDQRNDELPVSLITAILSWNTYQQNGDMNELAKAINGFRETAQQTPDTHANKPAYLACLCVTLLAYHLRGSNIVDLNNSISVGQYAVNLTPDSIANKPFFENYLACALWTRCQEVFNVDDLNLAIACWLDAVRLIPDDHAEKTSYYGCLSVAFAAKYQVLKNPSDYQYATVYGQLAAQRTSTANTATYYSPRTATPQYYTAGTSCNYGGGLVGTGLNLLQLIPLSVLSVAQSTIHAFLG